MTQEDDQDRPEPLEDGEAARHIANLTGMSPEAARAFAGYHSGRFAQGSGFEDAA
jgi:hypothetical protein